MVQTLQDKQKNSVNISSLIDSIYSFVESKGIAINPKPTVVLNNNPCDYYTENTAQYIPSQKTIILKTYERNDVDILRSFCHELWHHHQNISWDKFKKHTNCNILSSISLQNIEYDAYANGGLIFRIWQESKRKYLYDNKQQ